MANGLPYAENPSHIFSPLDTERTQTRLLSDRESGYESRHLSCRDRFQMTLI